MHGAFIPLIDIRAVNNIHHVLVFKVRIACFL